MSIHVHVLVKKTDISSIQNDKPEDLLFQKDEVFKKRLLTWIKRLCDLFLFWNQFFFSLPQEDSDYEREHTPPTPPPRKLSRKGASLRLRCLGKQESDENPLMKKVAEPLKLTQSQVVKIR